MQSHKGITGMHFEYSTAPSLLCTIKFCVKQLSADAPCINLQERERRTKIPQEISDFGLFLLEDHNGVRIRSKALKHMNFATEINIQKCVGALVAKANIQSPGRPKLKFYLTLN